MGGIFVVFATNLAPFVGEEIPNWGVSQDAGREILVMGYRVGIYSFSPVSSHFLSLGMKRAACFRLLTCGASPVPLSLPGFIGLLSLSPPCASSPECEREARWPLQDIL